MRWLKARLRAVVMRAASGRIDLTRVDKVPDSLGWPLQREGVDPPARLAEIRAAEPVHHLTTFLGMKVWLVTGRDAALEVLGDLRSYSTDIRPYVGKAGAQGGDIGGLGFTDPPDHTRLRKLLTPEFTKRRLRRLEPLIERIVAEQLDEIERVAREGDGVVDLVPTFGFAVPFLVICELLGLADERRETFRELGSARFDVTGGGYGTFGAISGSRRFLMEETARQRVSPGPGLLGQIIREHGDEIDDFDLGGLADGVFTGGMETSAGMLALGTAVLLRTPGAWQRLAEDPAALDPIIEELLRYLSVVQVAFPRFALTDVEVGGQQVRKGDVVMVSLPAASRDTIFSGGPADDGEVVTCPVTGAQLPRPRHDPEAFDPDRPLVSHLAFGHGLHRCVGAELARMELRAAFSAIARRFPDMAVATDRVPDAGLPFHGQSLVFGVDAVPVRPLGDPVPAR